MADSIGYSVPHIPELLSLASFLYFINVAESLLSHLLHAGLLGPLFVGIIYGSQAADLLSVDIQSTFITIGYIGLILLVFEAGLTTDISLLLDSIILSAVVALTGVLLPIAFSLLLLHFGFHYTPLQAFSAGASLCSTSLGTTLALLDPAIRRTRVGSVLLSAALLDDIVGLVIAAVISGISSDTNAPIRWQTIVRPILVSVAFAVVVPFLAWTIRMALLKLRGSVRSDIQSYLTTGSVQLFIMVCILSGFVAGSQFAGTSELFGAYLAGAFLAYIIPAEEEDSASTEFQPVDPELPPSCQANMPATNLSTGYSPERVFVTHIAPSLATILSPIFFASIGAALPIRTLGSRRAVWRGIVYSVLMVLAKLAVGAWIWIWPSHGCRRTKATNDRRVPEGAATMAPPPHPALLLGLAMVPRGEIALIVAQLARPILLGDDEEPFAVVTWAILITTVGGAVGVGWLLRNQRG
ncbi:hypothetical protein PLICRDRAFT_163156 [Plicaturopsis crispa FD-325 SS-3]|nr:hypothetical protein PLICRDRAFT_163156 [Plicaturopsis crispa FD-325 SS-3]